MKNIFIVDTRIYYFIVDTFRVMPIERQYNKNVFIAVSFLNVLVFGLSHYVEISSIDSEKL